MFLFSLFSYAIAPDCELSVGSLLLDEETGRYSMRFIASDEEIPALESLRGAMDVDYIYNYIEKMSIEALDMFQCYLLLSDDLRYAHRELQRNLVFNMSINNLDELDVDNGLDDVFDKYAKDIYDIAVCPRKRSHSGDSCCVPPTVNSEAIEM